MIIRVRNSKEGIPATLRQEWRVPQICLALDWCRGKRASLTQLQVLLWALRSPASMERFQAAYDRPDGPDRPVVRFDPAIAHAIDRTVALRYALQIRTGLKLSEEGGRLVRTVLEAGWFEKELQMLELLDGRVVQARVEAMMPRNRPFRGSS